MWRCLHVIQQHADLSPGPSGTKLPHRNRLKEWSECLCEAEVAICWTLISLRTFIYLSECFEFGNHMMFDHPRCSDCLNDVAVLIFFSSPNSLLQRAPIPPCISVVVAVDSCNPMHSVTIRRVVKNPRHGCPVLSIPLKKIGAAWRKHDWRHGKQRIRAFQPVILLAFPWRLELLWV